jgi:hypothetical protein
MSVKSQQELLETFHEEVNARDPSLTDDSEGSKLDTIAGAVTTAVSEAQRVIVDEFKKTFIDTANGPEVTGDVDDLQRLLVDHWGDEFARPDPTKAVGTVTFTRANDDAGDCDILAGTVVSTAQSAAGTSQRFETLSDVTMVGTTISASIQAIEAGPAGDVNADTITQIETSLTDPSITVNNDDACSGGADTLSDADYRQYARNLLRTLGGGSTEAIEAAAKTVAGIVYATCIEFVKTVKEWVAATSLTTGDSFKVVYPVLYIADINGNASQPLIDAVETAIEEVRAGGAQVQVLAAVAILIDWSLEITLDPGGPNYSTLASDPSMIVDSMNEYIRLLAVGDDFVKADAEDYIMGLWGPLGSGDLDAISTSVPSGNVTIDVNEKALPGTVEIV